MQLGQTVKMETSVELKWSFQNVHRTRDDIAVVYGIYGLKSYLLCELNFVACRLSWVRPPLAQPKHSH